MDADVVMTDLFILVGFAFIVLGVFIKKFYYGKGLYGVSLSNKPAPTWAGRLLFISIGSIFVLFGFAHLLFGYGTIH